MTKHQGPNHKQIQSTKAGRIETQRGEHFDHLNFIHWCLSVIWCLGFGASREADWVTCWRVQDSLSSRVRRGTYHQVDHFFMGSLANLPEGRIINVLW
jgi:hypothetical protein